MSRAQPKSSPTDEYARRIAQAIAKGRPPPFNAAFDRYCGNSPREIFAAFTGAARHMPPAGNDEPLAIGYLFLLQRLLEHLRYRTDQGYADAAKLISDFQTDVVTQVEAGNVDGHRRSLPRHRQSTSVIETGTKRFRATSMRLSPASSKPATAIRSWRSPR